MYVLIAAALLPAALLLLYIYRMDRVEREPARLLGKLLLFGVISAIPAILLEELLGGLIDRLFVGLVHVAVSNFIGVALVEEGCKLFFLKKGSWRDPAFDHRFDGIVYAVFVSLGFAAIENVLYVLQYGMSVAGPRAIFSLPGHMAFGVFMGMYYAEAKAFACAGDPVRSRARLRRALVVPVLLHGAYDFCLSVESGVLTLVFFVLVVLLDVRMLRTVRRCAANDAPMPGTAFSAWGQDTGSDRR